MAVPGTVKSSFVRKRIERAFLGILACYVLLVGRLAYLQGWKGAEIREMADRLRDQKIVLKSHRGSIYDREGKLLAVSLYAGTVGFDPKPMYEVGPDQKKRDKARETLNANIHRVAGILGMPEAQVVGIVSAGIQKYAVKQVRFVPIKKAVSLEVAQQIRDARPRLIGFGVDDGSRRFYPNAENAAHVVGFMGSDDRGKAGVEESFQQWMTGIDGWAWAQLDSQRREIPDTQHDAHPARDGYDVITTIDTSAQQIATEEANKVFETYHPAGVSVVIVDPNNGDVLALVSLPNYNPNPGMRSTLNANTFMDRCAAHLYEPGSTLKSLTIASALDSGTITTSSMFFCPGAIQVGNKTIHCVLHGSSEKFGHGRENPEQILQHSCNIGAAEIGMKMGPDLTFNYMGKFGLFDPLRVGLPAEQYGRLSFDKHENIHTNAKVARVAFGHSITTTPLHVAMAYAAIVNEGMLMRPRIVSEIRDSNGKIIKSWKPQQVRQVVKPEVAETVTGMLRVVVANGTGKVAAIPGYVVAGKTGTARKYAAGKYVGSFIGIAPASLKVKPRAVVLVAVDEPKGAYYGAEVAAPAFQAIMRRLLACWRVPEDDPDATQAREAAFNLKRTGQIVPASIKRAVAQDKD